MSKKILTIMLFAFFILSCNLLGAVDAQQSLEDAALQSFEAWIEYPYRDLEIVVLENDGDFATLSISIDLRLDKESDWSRVTGIMECSMIGDSWN